MIDWEPSPFSLSISVSWVGRLPGRPPTGFSSLHTTRWSTDFKSCVCQSTVRSIEPLSTESRNSTSQFFILSLHFPPWWRFFKSELNTNESNTAPWSIHNLCNEIDTRFTLLNQHMISVKQIKCGCWLTIWFWRIPNAKLQLISNDHNGSKLLIRNQSKLSLSSPQATLSKLQYQL